MKVYTGLKYCLFLYMLIQPFFVNTAVAGLIINKVSLDKTSLDIPKGGLSAKIFTVSFEVKNDWNTAIQLDGIDYRLLELDPRGPDLVVKGTVNTSLMFAPNATLTFNFSIFASSLNLNSQCGGGCDTPFGRLAELKKLEFGIDGEIKYFHKDDPAQKGKETFKVSEPSVIYMLGVGGFLVYLKLGKARDSKLLV